MDYLELFDRQGREFDDLLMAAVKLAPDQFTAPAPDGGPSLRDLMVELLDTPRGFVHGSLQGRRHIPLAPERVPTPLALGPILGGFRLTLLDLVEELSPADLARKVSVPDGSGGKAEWSTEAVLKHLLAEGTRVGGLAAHRLRTLQAENEPTHTTD